MMNLDYNFFEIDQQYITPVKGKILIAEPFMRDPYFKRSIVLLTEHNEDGSVGFVLNKPVDIPVHEVFKEFPRIDTEISIGGPVATNTVHYLHTLGDIIPNSMNVIGDIYWGGDFDFIQGLIKTGKLNQDQIRFFLGYSGWQPNQLDNELEEKSWIVTDIDESFILERNYQNMWKTSLSRLGDKYKLWSGFPEDPAMN